MGTKICPTCKGHGTIIKKVYMTCLYCFGRGYIGFLKEEKCPMCGGEGKISSFFSVGEKYITCPTCEGRGHIYEE